MRGMKRVIGMAAWLAAAAPAWSQVSQDVIDSLSAADRYDTSIDTLQFVDGVPTAETAQRVRDAMDFTNALNVYNNSFRGASAYAIAQGIRQIAGEDNSIVIFSELMDSKSLFLTANADTVYYMSVIDLTSGPMVIEQPSNGLGTINDMWFSWVIDIGRPGPDRGQGGEYLLVPPGYDGPLPEGGYFIAHSTTNHLLYAARTFLVDDDPRPAVANIKQNLKVYPYTPGGYGTSIATALEGEVRLGQNPPVPPTRFVEASHKAFNTIPPSDHTFFEMINDNYQAEPATSYDVELAGQLAAIGIVHGKPFKPDARMKRILSDAAAVGNAAGRSLNWRYAVSHPEWAYYPDSQWGEHALRRRRVLRDAAAGVCRWDVQALPADRRSHARFAHGLLLRLHAGLARHDHADSGRGLAVPDGLPRRRRRAVRWLEDLQGHLAEGHPRAGVLVAHALRQPDPVHAADASGIPARRQPELPVARSRRQSETARRRCTSGRRSPAA